MNIRFDTFNVFISALELFKLYVKIPSNSEFSLANTLSGLKEELRDGFASIKRELSEEHDHDPDARPPCEDPVLPEEGLAIFEASDLFVAFSPQLISPASEFKGRGKLHAFTGQR